MTRSRCSSQSQDIQPPQGVGGGAPTLYFQTTDNDSASHGEQTASTQKRKGIKSGKLHTTDTIVLTRITLLHEVVYTSDGQMSSVHFVNEYLTVMAEEPEEVKSEMQWHRQELIEDAEVYGWKCIRFYHTAWLRQLEHSQAT